MEKENKKVNRKIRSASTISVSIFTIIIALPLTFIIYHFKLENASFLSNTFSKYAVSFLIAFIITQLITAIVHKLILLVLTLIGVFIVKKIAEDEENKPI
ncbi:hypothetical protein [Brachyspira intermedia]|uniref:hypothetical protein n=1 Tax=Brachyspira intermedia TaxID=84377 RepID=UPI0003131377|nr:hypothetical protein [Brachyspira intermedia]